MKSRFGRHHRRAKALGPCLLASAAALSATDRAAAVNKAWAASGSGSWNVAGNWSPAGQPQAGDVAMLLSSAADDRLVTYANTSNPGADLNAVRIDATGAGRMELHFVPAFAHGLRADEMHLGINGRGWVDQSAGTVTLVGGLYVGAAFAGAGTYTIRGGRLSAFEAFVGDFGAGALVQTGGNVDVDDRLVLGFDGTGTHALSGGTVTTNQLVVGYGGNGTLDQTGGVVDTVQVNLGQSGGVGRYNLGGTGALVTDQLYLGFGTFTQTGGRNTAGVIVLGKDASGNGTYTISGGTLSATQLYVGGAGRGVLNHLG